MTDKNGNHDYEVILTVVNAGYSDAVMETAKSLGAGGGTVIHARGTASRDAEKLFGITIQPEKEIVMCVVPRHLADGILHGLYKSVGLGTPGGGISFTLPIDAVVGIKDSN